MEAVADRDDLVTIDRAGPLKRGDTTFRDAKRWFGEPTRKDRHPYQCIRVIDAVWRNRLRLLFDTFDNSLVVAIVRDRSVQSERHGELAFHTRKGLRVGDRAREVRNKYPNADRHEHRNYNHHILVRSGNGRLEATTKNNRVTELRSFPYEAC